MSYNIRLLLTICSFFTIFIFSRIGTATEGKVIFHDTKKNTITVNIGKSDGLTVGSYLTVYKIISKIVQKSRALKRSSRGNRIKVAIAKVITVKRTNCVALIRQMNRDVYNLRGYLVVFKGMVRIGGRKRTAQQAPRIALNVGFGYGSTDGFEFKRDRWSPGQSSSDDGITNVSTLDIPNVSSMVYGVDLTVWPFSFQKKQTFYTNLFGIGTNFSYGSLSSFDIWAANHLFGDDVEEGQIVSATGSTMNLGVDLRMRMGGTIFKNVYSSGILKIIPYDTHRINLEASTILNKKALLKSLSFRFIGVGIEGEVLAKNTFGLRGFVDLALPFLNSISAEWDKEAVHNEDDPTTFYREINYVDSFFWRYGISGMVGYKTFRFSVFFKQGRIYAENDDGITDATSEDKGTYETSEHWYNIGLSVGVLY